MQPAQTRRRVLTGLTAATVFALPAAAGQSALQAIEARNGGRLGLFVLDTGSGRSLAWRADERFLMCSTFKPLAVAKVLARVEAGQEQLERSLAYGEKDLLDYAPVARAHVAEGALSIRQLCAAAIQVSDNTAANLLMASFGGPAALTAHARSLGEPITRLDRWEPQANVPDGEKDTTSPRAMAGNLRELLLGKALQPSSRAMLEGWLVTATPGLQRLRAALPSGWKAGDKAGTGEHQTNDVAIIRPPSRAPLVAAAYYERPEGMAGPAAEAVLRDAGAALVGWAG